MLLDFKNAFELQTRVLGRRGMRAVMRRLLWQDLATLPAFLFFAPSDVLRVFRKRFGKVRAARVQAPDAFPYPPYYFYDFHHQANGNFSWRAALTSEWQIRFLFVGCSHTMRQGVVDEIPEGDQLSILDVACGTGSWVPQGRLQNRHHKVTGIDLSPSYLRLARRSGKFDELLQMNAESLPDDWSGRFDIVTCIWLFHELPAEAQERVAAELARVLKPSGRLVFMDALQWNQDMPELFAMMGGKSIFAQVFNEPHFAAYLEVDLRGLFSRHGLELESEQHWFKSKVLTARKLS